jgi:isoquinoline 1-oxidoreductase subunit beta
MPGMVYAAMERSPVMDAALKAVDDAGAKQVRGVQQVVMLGGGFGRKSKPDYAAEAALLSKKVGKPVKIVWSREDDLRFDYYHSPAGLYMKAAVDEKGLPTA